MRRLKSTQDGGHIFPVVDGLIREPQTLGMTSNLEERTSLHELGSFFVNLTALLATFGL